MKGELVGTLLPNMSSTNALPTHEPTRFCEQIYAYSLFLEMENFSEDKKQVF